MPDFGSASSSLLIADGHTAPPWQATPRTQELLQELARTDAWRSPARSAEHLLAASVDGTQFHCINDLMSQRELQADAVYQAFSAQGLQWQVGTAIPLDQAGILILTFERESAAGRHDVRRLQLLVPLRTHLARAGTIATALARERARGALTALAAIGMPAAILDRRGTVLEATPRLDAVLPRARRGERIALGDAAGEALLGAILRGESARRAVAVPALPPAAGCIVQLVHLAGAVRDLFGGGLWLLIVSGGGGMPPGVEPAVLCGVFALSAAESRLASALASGASLTSAAQRCGIRIGTARSYLERIFHKTGCHRQAELVALLLGIARAAPAVAHPARSPG